MFLRPRTNRGEVKSPARDRVDDAPSTPITASLSDAGVDELRTEVTQLRAQVALLTQTTTRQVQIAVESAEESARSALKDAARRDANVLRLLEDVKSDAKALERRVEGDTSERLTRQDAAAEERVAALEARLAGQIGTIQAESQASATSLGARISTVAEEVTAQMTAMLAAEASRSAQTTAALQQELNRATADLQRQLDEAVRSLFDRQSESDEQRRADIALARAEIAAARDDLAAANERVAETQTRLRTELLAVTETVAAQVRDELATEIRAAAERSDAIDHRVTALDATVDDRVAAAESRVDERLAVVAARVADDLGPRLEGLDTSLAALTADHERTAFNVLTLQDRLGEIDARALDMLRERVSTVAGEAALARIEMDRLTAGLDDRFDRILQRLGSVETKVTSDSEVEMSVQLDRIDELERALAELDPDRYVLRDELAGTSNEET
jgi:hypothetical protein